MKYYVPSPETKQKIDAFHKGKEDALDRTAEFIKEELGIESHQFHIGHFGFIPDDEKAHELPKFLRIDSSGCWTFKLNTKQGRLLKKKFDDLETRGYTSFDFLFQFLTTENRSSGRFSWGFDIVNGEYALTQFDNIDVEGLVKEGRFIEKTI